MGEYLCIGDYLCLFCEDTQGYVYSDRTSETCNGLIVYQGQERENPVNIPNVHVITFQVFTQNRYKLTKKYRKLLDQYGAENADEGIRTLLDVARAAADSESQDNVAEQRRLRGKRLRYGEIIQLRHVFTDKYIHVSTTETSRVDKNKMMVTLETYNSKHAQFRILPRCKVKAEGEPIEVNDQVVIESVKSPGTFLHASDPYRIDRFSVASELNLGVEKAGFTVVHHYRPAVGSEIYLRGGSVVRMFHKDLEAYLVAEGLFGENPREDVHLRVREINQMDPRTLYPPRSGITYWQVESKDSVIDGRIIRWEEQVRFRHMTLCQYLSVTEDNDVQLTPDADDPGTVFKLHSLSQCLESEEVMFGSNARVEHLLTGTWLHGPIGSTYVKKETQSTDGSSMQALRWDHAQLVPFVASTLQQYPDAFTVQKVEREDRNTFNYVAGHVSFIRNLIAERHAGTSLNSKRTTEICGDLMQLREFILIGGQPCKVRQKLLRNLRVVDLLVELLQCPLPAAPRDWHYHSQILKAIYRVLHAYTSGSSRKNALYFAKYIDFFETQLGVKGGVGLHCCDMLIDLIKDNRKIVDRIKPKTLDHIITLLSQNKHYRFLELLGVLCVCNGIGFTENQTRIAKKLLEERKESLFHMKAGDPDGDPSAALLSVSPDNEQTWIPLHKFVFEGNPEYSKEQYLFLERQLELYKLLCYGRNPVSIEVITSHAEYLPWDVAMLGLRSEVLPDRIRAKFCDLIIGLFVDVGDHTGSAEMVTSNNFIYTDLLTEAEQQAMAICATDVVARDLDQNYPLLRQWIRNFFQDNTRLVASLPDRNLLMQQVLRLVTYLLQYRYMGLEAEHDYIRVVINLIDGSKDVPFPPDKGNDYSHDKVRGVMEYRYRGRFVHSAETDAIIAARLQSLELLDLLLVRDFNRRIKNFVTSFKEIVEKQKALKKKKKKTMTKLFEDGFLVTTFWKDSKLRRKTQKLLASLHPKTELVGRNLPKLLFDLTYYPSNDLSTKALFIMNKIYSSNSDLLQKALRSQVLLSYESSRIHQEALENMVTLRRLARSKLDQEHAAQMCQILGQFTELCHVPDKPKVPHIVGQNILVNNGVLEVVMEVALQEVDIKLHDQYQICCTVISKALVLLRYLVQGNAYVQNYVFEHLDSLLEVQACGSELALALQEVFIGSPLHCLRVHPRQMQALVRLVGQYQEEAPEFLCLLRSLVKIEASNMVLKRNQFLVTKLIMENYKTAAYVMDMAKVDRMKMLVGKKGEHHQHFLANLVDLLAACAEGENRYIESLCQTLLSMEEILTVLNNRNVPLHLKAPFARYLVWAYMRTARSKVESGVDELPHDSHMWKHLKVIWTMMQRVVEKEVGNKSFISNVSMAETLSTSSSVRSEGEAGVDVGAVLTYMLNGGILLLEVFFSKFYEPDAEFNEEEPEVLKRIVASFLPLCDVAAEYVTQSSHLLNIISCLETLMNKVALPRTTLERAQGRMDLLNALSRMKERIEKQVDNSYNREELEINKHLHNLAQNCLHFLEGKNTVASQLRAHFAGSQKKEYVSADDVAKLPLGLEFQTHVKCFYFSSMVKMSMEKKYGRALKLIDQLAVSARRYKQQASGSQEALDIKSLQILRALLHNLIIQLPEGWENQTNKSNGLLEKIEALQGLFQKYDVIAKVMPMLARRNLEIGNQIMALLDVLLFNANRDVQRAVLDYFRGTKEEVFFVYLRNRLHIATMAHKERRSMEAQKRAKQSAQQSAASMIQEHSATANGDVPQVGQSAIQEDQVEVKGTPSRKRKSMADALRPRWRGKLLVSSFGMGGSDTGPPGFINLAFDAGFEEQEMNLDDYNEGSDIYLVLQALAGLCDGQNADLQNYLREQPDNVRSVNLVSEVTQFINVLYSHVTGSTIDLLAQLFSTLNEICQGNQENRAVIMNNKIVDYMNFILRISIFEGCDPQQVLELRSILGTLLKSLIEENSPEAMLLAKDVRDTIDVEALAKVMTTCHTVYQADNPNVEDLICKSGAAVGPSFSGAALLGKMKNVVMESKGIKEVANDVGFIYYLVLGRMVDVGLPVEAVVGIQPSPEKKAFNYYKNQCMSVEIVKDDHLQKINFRVTNKALLREEVKEVVKWDIDRSSPSAKLRDLTHWSRDILKDIDYQRTILSNPLVRQLAKRWAIWNYLCIFLSIVINIMMLVTWTAPMAIEEVDETAEELPPDVYNPVPVIGYTDYYLTLFILGGLHNACSIMLFFSYMLLKHPTMPDFIKAKYYWSPRQDSTGLKLFHRKKDEDSGSPTVEKKPEESSKLEVKLLSGITIYYLAFVALSLAGTFFHGYFFAFHLLNIVANNQLLRGVIKAVTLNGMSLLWVGVMGLIIIYLYALIGFALMRPVFRPNEELFCATLAQCTATVIRYGLVGDIDEMFKRHDLEKTFANFGYLTLYQVSFFIIFTTIGLNIIFGIIVDTFSELRDLKWTAEKDMRDTCFICSRDSYDFEHAGHGFQQHVRQEHNMWAYIFYFIHLNEVKENDYTALDLFVHNLLKHEKLDFFPLNRALCLAHSTEDSTDSKIDDVMKTVYAIRARQQEEEAQRRRAEERRRQLVWQETYRHRSTRASTAPSTVTDSDNESFPPPPGPDAAAV